MDLANNLTTSESPASPELVPSRRAPLESLSLSAVELRAGGIVLILALIARFQAFLPGYSIDDYQFMLEDLPPWFEKSAIASGRSLAQLMAAALARIGAAPPRAGVLFTVLLILVLIAVGLSACRLWGLSGRLGPTLVVTSFVVLHPFQAEMFTFRTATMIVAVSLALSFAAMLMCHRSRLYWWVSVIAMACALSIYQVVLNYLAMVLLFTVTFEFARSGMRMADQYRRLRAQLGMIAAGTAIYLISTRIISYISGFPLSTRTAFLRPDEIGARVAKFAGSIGGLLYKSEGIMPAGCKLVMLFTFGVGLAALVVDVARRQPPNGFRKLLVLMGAALVGIPLCFGVILALRDWWLTPRAMSQTALYWAGVMAMIYTFVQPRMRRVLSVGLVLIIFSFIGINEEIFADQHRVNRRDMAEANRIILRLEELPDFRQIDSILLAGGTWRYASAIGTVEGDMNISALYPEWAKREIVNELSGYAFKGATVEVKDQGTALCKTAPKWPATDSIIKLGSTAVVCLSGDN